MPTPIDSFNGKHHFLSNFHPSKVVLDDEEYPSVEHAYQAAKTANLSYRKLIREAISPGTAKKLGKKAPLRPDWEAIKLSVMENLLRQKFKQPDLRQALVDTGDAELIEGNWWGDVYWGVCASVGENHLGKLLMKIRSDLVNHLINKN